MSAPDPSEQALLVVIDPVARRVDGESVRIARDVLRGGAATKICLPDGPEEVERALARRGRRRPVVIGDDSALLHVVNVLQRRRELADIPVSLVPVGPLPAVSLARTLGVPLGPVAAARAVLDGTERRLDVLVDEAGGVVLGGLWIPGGYGPGGETDAPAGTTGPNGSAEAVEGGATAVEPVDAAPGPGCATAESVVGGGGEGHQPWWSPAARTARSALTLLTGPAAAGRVPLPGCTRLRIEADGVLVTDLDQPVTRVSVAAADGGLAELTVHAHDADHPRRQRARRVTISGPAFRYRADNALTGPVRRRTWTAHAEGWRLVLPRG
ncbi:diacylglycerol kinase [Streptomyces roseifaciens]